MFKARITKKGPIARAPRTLVPTINRTSSVTLNHVSSTHVVQRVGYITNSNAAPTPIASEAIAKRAGDDELLGACDNPSDVTDDLAWAEAITLWLADSLPDSDEQAEHAP